MALSWGTVGKLKSISHSSICLTKGIETANYTSSLNPFCKILQKWQSLISVSKWL